MIIAVSLESNTGNLHKSLGGYKVHTTTNFIMLTNLGAPGVIHHYLAQKIVTRFLAIHWFTKTSADLQMT